MQARPKVDLGGTATPCGRHAGRYTRRATERNYVDPPYSQACLAFLPSRRIDQVRLDAGADLMALDQLDQKLWVALACPTTGLQFDAKTLALIDTTRTAASAPPNSSPP